MSKSRVVFEGLTYKDGSRPLYTISKTDSSDFTVEQKVQLLALVRTMEALKQDPAIAVVALVDSWEK